MSEVYTIEDLKKFGVVSDDTPISEAERLLKFANDPNTYFAYDVIFAIHREHAASFIGFVLHREKPGDIPDDVWEAMTALAVKLKIECHVKGKPLFGSWGPW